MTVNKKWIWHLCLCYLNIYRKLYNSFYRYVYQLSRPNLFSETKGEVTKPISSHDDVIKLKHFPLLALYEGNPPVTDGYPLQRPVTRSVDVFFGLRLNKWLSKQSRRRIWDAIVLIITSMNWVSFFRYHEMAVRSQNITVIFVRCVHSLPALAKYEF